jgi:hypothetical protein
VQDGLNSNTVLCVASAGKAPTGGQPTAAGTVFAGGVAGLAGSMDGGKSWRAIGALGGLIDLAGHQINDVVYLQDDYFGIATEHAGFLTFSNPLTPQGTTHLVTATRYTTKDGLASDRVRCALVPQLNSLTAYLGHMGEGLSWISGPGASRWTVVNRNNGLAGNYVLSIRQGTYQGIGQLYACGYDAGAGAGAESAALSISSDGGRTWKAINKFDLTGIGTDIPLSRLYDVWCDAESQTLYGFFGGSADFGGMLLAKSMDNGASWKDGLVDSFDPLAFEENCYPTLAYANNRLFVAGLHALHIYDMEVGQIGYADWADGLQGRHTGALSIDAVGRIYLGTSGLGIAKSNLEYVPMYNHT